MYELHERAEDVRRSVPKHSKHKGLVEIDEVLEEMEDYIYDYRKKKEFELEKKNVGEDQALAKTWKKFPKPGTNPQVTFKPDKFVIKSGFLFKKGLKRRSWKKRFFRIFLDDPHNLYYYKDASQAERDIRLDKRLRKGKKISLLFANIGKISECKVFYKRRHNNRNIIQDYELFIQTKSVKKVTEKGKKVTKTVLGRVYFLSCLSEVEKDKWLETLKYVENQTDKCIKEHQEKIKKGIELKKIYFRQLKQNKKGKKGKEEEKEEEEKKVSPKELEKWDRAQLISVYGTGVAQAMAGKKANFVIEDNKKGKKKKSRFDFDESLLVVVLESNELHYDLEPERLEKNKFICDYLCTRKGNYELSVLYDGCDVYGSPFNVTVTPAPLSSSNCSIHGQNYILLSTSGASSGTMRIELRNKFDERVNVKESVEYEISTSAGLEVTNLDEISKAFTKTEETHVDVKYIVNSEEILKQQTDRRISTAWISFKIKDNLQTPSFLKAIKNSPFSLNIILQEQQQPQVQFQQQYQHQQPTPTYTPTPPTDEYTELPLQDKVRKEVVSPLKTQSSGFGYFKDSLDSTRTFKSESPQAQDGYFVKQSLFSPVLQKSQRRTEVRRSQPAPTPVRSVEKKYLRLFEPHETVMRSLQQFFGSDLKGLVQLCTSYDIIPTFISKSEVRNIIRSDGELSFEDFIVGLAEIAIFCLSKPMFAHLYSTDKSKINVLLNMWGVADANKIMSLKQQT